MDFKDCCKQLAERVSNLKEQICTEEATKNAYIMPFIQMLGYDVFNPTEVIPEMDCDLVKKKGEKIDYAIMKDGEPIMLIECKHWKQDLSLHSTQLQRYFVASKAKFGVLTNGIVYRFYTDLAKPNIMDTTPFLEINMEELKDATIEELKKFHKSYFDLDNIMSTANQLKYVSELKTLIRSEFNNPSADFVRFFTKQIYDSSITQRVIEQFKELVKKSLAGYVNDVMSDRLNVAMKATSETPVQEYTDPEQELSDSKCEQKFVTTEEELEGFYIVKSILRNNIDSGRITYRDAQSYFAIFADDNNRKPICRLYFNTANKQIGIFDVNKNEQKHKISTLDEIYDFHEELKNAVLRYL